MLKTRRHDLDLINHVFFDFKHQFKCPNFQKTELLLLSRQKKTHIKKGGTYMAKIMKVALFIVGLIVLFYIAVFITAWI